MIRTCKIWVGDFPILYAEDMRLATQSHDDYSEAFTFDASRDFIPNDHSIFEDGMFGAKRVVITNLGSVWDYKGVAKSSGARRAYIDVLPGHKKSILENLLLKFNESPQEVDVFLGAVNPKVAEAKILDGKVFHVEEFDNYIPTTGKQHVQGELEGDVRKFSSWARDFLQDRSIGLDKKALAILLSAVQNDRKALAEVLAGVAEHFANPEGEFADNLFLVTAHEMSAYLKSANLGRATLFNLIDAMLAGDFTTAIESFERLDWPDSESERNGLGIALSVTMERKMRALTLFLNGKPSKAVLDRLDGAGHPYYLEKQARSKKITAQRLLRGIEFCEETYRMLTGGVSDRTRFDEDGGEVEVFSMPARENILTLVVKITSIFG